MNSERIFHGRLTSSDRVKWLACVCLSILMEFVSWHLSGLKSMVTQGVKNPMVDLLSLEDKTLDEVRDVKL